MNVEIVGQLKTSSFLNVQHNSQRFSGLMRPEFVDQVMHMDEQQVQIFDFLFSFSRVRRTNQVFKEVEEIGQNGMIQLVQFLLPVQVFTIVIRVQLLNAFCLIKKIR